MLEREHLTIVTNSKDEALIARLDPAGYDLHELENIVRGVFRDINKGMIIKVKDQPSYPVHASLPEFNDPKINKDNLVKNLAKGIKDWSDNVLLIRMDAKPS